AAPGERHGQRRGEPPSRSDLMVDRQPGDPGAARHGVDAEPIRAAPDRQEVAGRAQDPLAGPLDRALPPAEPVGAGAHGTIDINCTYCLYKYDRRRPPEGSEIL